MSASSNHGMRAQEVPVPKKDRRPSAPPPAVKKRGGRESLRLVQLSLLNLAHSSQMWRSLKERPFELSQGPPFHLRAF